MNKKDSEKIKKAIALKYKPEENSAPVIVAKGKGETAERIIGKANESDVPIYYEPNLSEVLVDLKLGQEIPQEFYEIVAEILIFISSIDEKYGMYND